MKSFPKCSLLVDYGRSILKTCDSGSLLQNDQWSWVRWKTQIVNHFLNGFKLGCLLNTNFTREITLNVVTVTAEFLVWIRASFCYAMTTLSIPIMWVSVCSWKNKDRRNELTNPLDISTLCVFLPPSILNVWGHY